MKIKVFNKSSFVSTVKIAYNVFECDYNPVLTSKWRGEEEEKGWFNIIIHLNYVEMIRIWLYPSKV